MYATPGPQPAVPADAVRLLTLEQRVELLQRQVGDLRMAVAELVRAGRKIETEGEP